ncbi:MAG: ABC transporter permease [Gemmataceae bacterium]|nr:ABC transporter permease [Gemmataceae bacterium]
MSTTTTTPPTDPLAPGAAPRVEETAPSQTIVEAPTVARLVGFGGLFLLVLGAVAVVTNEFLGPRWIGKSGGFLFGLTGLVLMLYHAVRDGEQEVRRLYGLLAGVFLILALAAAFWPGPAFDSAKKDKVVGFHLVPWGIGFGILSLLFTIPFTRHETDEKYKAAVEKGLLYVGGALAIISLLAPVIGDLLPATARGNRLFRADFLAGPGLILGLLGLAFLTVHLGQTDTSTGHGYWVALAVGATGAAVVVYAIGRAVVPTVLFEGPAVLRKPNGALDTWRVVGRVLVLLLFAAVVALGAVRKWFHFPNWLRYAFIGVGAAGLAVFVLGSYKSMFVHSAPAPSLVPGGLILMGLGVTYLAVALGVCSDNQFVTLVRRELASYFLSPMGYLVLGGMALIEWLGYRSFIVQLSESGSMGRALPEPIVSFYFVALLPVFALVLQVPALTMRMVAEEKRTGSIEVLLTAPVDEAPVVVSKFVATWLFFLLSWLPAGLFLVALRYEVDQPFDYRPLLSFYVALAAQGLGFVGMGLFFSTVTRNQIVAAVFTLAGMMVFVTAYFIRREAAAAGIPSFVQVVISKMSFINMWIESLEGRLPLRDVLIYASLGFFFTFLSVKVLEARKWN